MCWMKFFRKLPDPFWMFSWSMMMSLIFIWSKKDLEKELPKKNTSSLMYSIWFILHFLIEDDQEASLSLKDVLDLRNSD